MLPPLWQLWILFSWPKINLKREFLKKLYPLVLLHIEIRLGEDPLEAFMIYRQLKGLTQQVVPPLFEGMTYN